MGIDMTTCEHVLTGLKLKGNKIEGFKKFQALPNVVDLPNNAAGLHDKRSVEERRHNCSLRSEGMKRKLGILIIFGHDDLN